MSSYVWKMGLCRIKFALHLSFWCILGFLKQFLSLVELSHVKGYRLDFVTCNVALAAGALYRPRTGNQ